MRKLILWEKRRKFKLDEKKEKKKNQTRWISSVLNLKKIPISRDETKSLERWSWMACSWRYTGRILREKKNQTRWISNVLNLKKGSNLSGQNKIRRFDDFHGWNWFEAVARPDPRSASFPWLSRGMAGFFAAGVEGRIPMMRRQRPFESSRPTDLIDIAPATVDF